MKIERSSSEQKYNLKDHRQENQICEKQKEHIQATGAAFCEWVTNASQ